MSAATKAATVTADRLLAGEERARYLEIENSALRAQLKALQEKATSDKVFAVNAENVGLRKALESLRADMDLAKDLGAKADAVREECARLAEGRGHKTFAKELRGSVTDSQRRVTDGT